MFHGNMRFTIKKELVKKALNIPDVDFPKYTTQIINLAGSNSQATNPRTVGQMSELTVESRARTIEEWREFYTHNMPDKHKIAADKIEDMIGNLREAMDYIDREMIDKWVDDLLINKTFYGFLNQSAILEQMSKRLNLDLDQAKPEDEAIGIDGYLGGQPVSVKPESYKNKTALQEEIKFPIIYYKKTSYGIQVDASEFIKKS